MRRRTVRITDVAREAGVSTATVSRVLNGAPSVDPELAERVRAAAAATRYVPNSNGRALRRQRADIWAAVVSDVQNPFFTSLVTAVEHVAVSAGYSVMLCNTDEQLDRERAYLEAAIAQRMAGVVVSVTSEQHSDLTPLLDAHIPTVVVDRRVQGFTGDTILMDNVEAGRLAGRHLLDLGHREVFTMAGPSGVSTTEDRLLGIREVLEAAGLPMQGRHLVRTDLKADEAETAVRAMLDRADRPTAIFASNGPLSTGAYRAIQRSGFRMPDDISLLGVDDERWTTMVNPNLTLIAQPVEALGRLAAERLLARAADDQTEAVHVLMAPEMKVRGTTGPVPAS
ncbi:LacI family DNA-binding transcriptional regulator [Pseudactinotalea sp. Z1739]|uniref:LacI family DNA-binding transcriptional regulator n=1 Tax=Pseudactinotalea sp. Z1739 TaxID=3413028 RepID=UPI003C7B2C44